MAEGCRCPVVCALPAPGNPLTNQIGCKHKSKQKDECTDAEDHVPKHVGIHVQMKRGREKNNTILGEQGHVDSAKEIAKPQKHARRRGRPRKAMRSHGPSKGHPKQIGQARKDEDSSTISRDRGWLNSTTFSYYLEHIWNSFPKEKLQSMAYFDPLMFYSYVNGYGNFVAGIKKQRTFLKKYVVVPIVLWSHWNLLIFCHLGESLNSKTKTPCMLLLDSLHSLGSTSRLEPIIRRLLNDMYKSEERHETEEQLRRMPLLVPKVPQQQNGSACGFYVLYYINLFLNNAPEDFNICSGYPYFMKEDWFTAEEVESFCQKLDALPPDPDDAMIYSTEDFDNGIETLGEKPDSEDATIYSTEDSGYDTDSSAGDSGYDIDSSDESSI